MERREISLVKRTLRNIEIPSLGIYIKRFQHNTHTNEVHLSVIYVNLNSGQKTEKEDLLVLPLTRFRMEYEIDLSTDDSAEFNWRPLKEIIA